MYLRKRREIWCGYFKVIRGSATPLPTPAPIQCYNFQTKLRALYYQITLPPTRQQFYFSEWFDLLSSCACFVCVLRKQLGQLKYLHMCIKESSRIFTPVPMISRTLDKTYEIDGHQVPEGK